MNDFNEDHIIQRQIFDLTFSSEIEAKNLSNEIERIFNQFLVPLLERILSQYDIPGHIVRIDRLEIDLGNIEPADLEFSWSKSLKRAVERKLSAVLDPQRSANLGQDAPQVFPIPPHGYNSLLTF